MKESTMSGMPNSPDGARERLSVLMDGEFPEEGREAAFAAVIGQDAMAEDWAVYHCIGDVLRSSDMGCHSPRLAQSVGERLRDEPHLLAPVVAHAGGVRGGYMRPLSALAAVAAVAAVGVVIWPQIGNQAAPVVAVTAPAPTPPVTPVRIAPVSVEYLRAHRQYSVGSTLRGSFAAQGQTLAYDESAR